MNNKYIGVFDSGLGGLTVVQAIQQIMDKESIVYYGDSKNCPYGTKEKDEIIELVKNDASFVNKFDLKAIVIACNTADSVAGQVIKNEYDIPVYGVIYPAALEAVSQSKNGKIGVIATNATVNSGEYVKQIGLIDSSKSVYQQACPRFVEFVEAGRVNKNDEEVYQYVKQCLKPLLEEGVDTLILGCTHYPLLVDIISDVAPNVKLISSSLALAKYLYNDLEYKGLIATQKKESVYYASKTCDDYNRLATLFLQQNIELKQG